jgi:hypothetical protein
VAVELKCELKTKLCIIAGLLQLKAEAARFSETRSLQRVCHVKLSRTCVSIDNLMLKVTCCPTSS